MAVTVLRRLRSSSEHRFYGWNIVAAGAVNNFLTAGLAVWGFGVYVSPLREEFGWSTAAIAAGFSIRSFQQGFLAPWPASSLTASGRGRSRSSDPY